MSLNDKFLEEWEREPLREDRGFSLSIYAVTPMDFVYIRSEEVGSDHEQVRDELVSLNKEDWTKIGLRMGWFK